MSSFPQPDKHVEQVQLPDGQTIDVICFTNAPDSTAPATPGDMHVCAACGSQLVHPVDWQPSGPDRWRVSLRCPECLRDREGYFDQESVDRFDVELDRGAEHLLKDLTALTASNMEEEVARFATALEQDLILPEDF